MNILQIYDSITVDMEEVRDIFADSLGTDIACVADMIEEIGKFRGKMIRPMLVLISGKACGNINNDHHKIAAVIEMIHIASLVHDDVIDEADVRRRGKTLNILHGNEAAVLLGDFLVTRAFGLCSQVGSASVSHLIAATSSTICQGELTQLYNRGNYELSEELYIDIISRKTASLMATACYLGSQLAKADERTCQAFENFGLNLGIAFQIADDITDILGDEQLAGKTLGCDLDKEKLTLPGIHFINTADQPLRSWAKQILISKDKNNHQLFIEKLKQSKSIEYARKKALGFIDKAKNSLPQNCHQKAKTLLLEIASGIIA